MRRWRPCSHRWGCGWRRRRPAWSTSTRASTSSASTSDGCGNGAQQVLRLHHPVPEGRPGRQGQGEGEDAQINPPHRDLDELLSGLNRSLAGWANYFRHGVSKATFSAIDSHTWLRLMRWLRRKYAGKHRLGMKELRRRFCDKGWRIRLQRGRVHRRLQRQRDPLSLPRQHHPDPVDPETGSRQPAADQRARHVERPVR